MSDSVYPRIPGTTLYPVTLEGWQWGEIVDDVHDKFPDELDPVAYEIIVEDTAHLTWTQKGTVKLTGQDINALRTIGYMFKIGGKKIYANE